MPIPMTIEGAESLREEVAHRKTALRQEITPVSYTHLTLPTICSV